MSFLIRNMYPADIAAKGYASLFNALRFAIFSTEFAEFIKISDVTDYLTFCALKYPALTEKCRILCLSINKAKESYDRIMEMIIHPNLDDVNEDNMIYIREDLEKIWNDFTAFLEDLNMQKHMFVDKCPPDGLKHQYDNVIFDLLNKAASIYANEDGYVNICSANQFIRKNLPGFNICHYGYSKLPELIQAYPDLYEYKRYQGKGSVIIFAYRVKED